MYERKVRKLKIIPRLLIVGEGKVTERIYLEGVRKQYELPKHLVQLELGKGTPKTLVDLAVKLKEENIKKHRPESGLRFDQVWCIFDRDSFTCIPDAKQKAKANGIEIAFTNPCFELFLLLHFENCTASHQRNVVRTTLKKKYLPKYDKSFDYNLLKDNYQKAQARTVYINGRSTEKGNIQTPPYCDVPDLIEALTPDTKRLIRWKTPTHR